MSFLSTLVMWCAVQTTLISFTAFVVVVVCRRLDRKLARTALLLGLSSLFLVTTLAASPWPRWELRWLRFDANSLSSEGNVDSESRMSPASIHVDADSTEPNSSRTTPSTSVIEHQDVGALGLPSVEVAHDATDQIEGDSSMVVASEAASSSTTSTSTSSEVLQESPHAVSAAELAGWIMLGIMGFGLARWLGGLWALGALRQESKCIDDLKLKQKLVSLCENFSVKRAVQLYENDKITTAATIGSRRPVILLPQTWRCWSDDERQAVLAHEVAHVQQRDFLCGMWAQFCLAAAYYQPLAHWLNRQLKLEMEFDADAAAVSVVGSAASYLRTLAELADRQDRQHLAWPARSFLLSHSTLLRRVAMLRQDPVYSARKSTGFRLAVTGMIALSCCVAMGLRGSGAAMDEIGFPERVLSAEALDTAGEKRAIEQDDHEPWKYVSEDSKLVYSIRLDAFDDSKAARTLAETLTSRVVTVSTAKVVLPSLASASRWTYVSPYADPSMHQVRQNDSILLTFGDEEAIRSMWQRGKENGFEEDEINGHDCFVIDGYKIIAQLDARTVCIAFHSQAIEMFSSEGATHTELKTKHWDEASKKQVSAYFQCKRWDAPDFFLTAVSPFWLDCRGFIASAQITNAIDVEVVAFCHDQESIRRVRETSDAVATLAMANVRQMPDRLKVYGGEEQAVLQELSKIIGELLDSRSFANGDDDNTLSLKMKSEAVDEQSLVRMLSQEATIFANERLRREDVNKMKQIMLALHNYHDTFGHFPPAVIKKTTADGKVVEHSWRVAILPFLDQTELYERYNFDEPWDSEANQEVLKSEIDIFRSSIAPGEPYSTSFFAVSGTGTMFGSETGLKIQEITDGSSNTMAVVILDRDTPWTKPEDFDWNPETVKQDLGLEENEQMMVGFADGSVRTYLKSISTKQLNAYISAQGRDNPSR